MKIGDWISSNKNFGVLVVKVEKKTKKMIRTEGKFLKMKTFIFLSKTLFARLARKKC